jgi:LacI family transcriptional regulator
LLLSDLTNPTNDLIAHGVLQRAAELGYDVIIANHSEIGGDKTFVKMLSQGHVDGILAFVNSVNEAEFEVLSDKRFGRILPINGKLKGIACSVSVDDGLASEMCVEHLVSLGHTNIVGIFALLNLDSPKRRAAGFKKACKRYGIEAKIISTQRYTQRDGYLATLEAINKYSPTAIFPSSNAFVLGTYRAIYENNLSIPDDISVMTLHNSEITEFMSPPLTNVMLPAGEMGRLAAEKLISMIDGHEIGHVTVGIPPQLVLRRSTANVNSNIIRNSGLRQLKPTNAS